MALRNAYDVFLLSKKTSAKDAVNTLDKLCHPLNCFLAACDQIFGRVDSLECNKTTKTASYLSEFNSQFTNSIPIKIQSTDIKIYVFIKRVFYILYKSITLSEYRVFLFKSLTDKNWYKEKLIQFGIKK